MKLEGKVAIVSAAGRGIGRAIALCLAEEGADLVVNSYRDETTAAVAGEIKAFGRRVLAVPGDVTDPDMISKIVDKSIDTFGKVDILVNNVGGGKPVPKEANSGHLGELVARWDGTYEQSLRAPALMCETVAPVFMEQRSGKIVSIGSIGGRGTPTLMSLTHTASPAYCAMKAGLIVYTQTLAERLGPYNVNVNCICPGMIHTDAWKGTSRRLVETVPDFKGLEPDELVAGAMEGRFPQMFRSTPLRRAATAESIGRAVVFLVSEDGKDITGQSLNVDSGMVKN